jgi:Na+(H+)/acetate symporter ActP
MNWTAISMFMVFVCFTLLVTRWAACAPARPATSTPPAVA